jgi:putative tricarboxylic transport membrane protein
MEYINLLIKMHDSPQWKETLQKQGWTDAFQAGDQFTTFLGEENTRVAGVLKELGLA